MTRTTLRKLTASTIVATGLTASAAVHAVPVTGVYAEDPRCDVLPASTLTHELGQQTFFPQNESFIWTFTPTQTTVCVPNDGLANDWIVQIRNSSGIAWNNLHFVVDLGGTFGNADGVITDLAGPAGVFTDAMRIDGTVTLGLNNNLLSESGPVDEIFQPGEIWRFNVSNFNVVGPNGNFLPPTFRTPGIFANSSPLLATNPGNASILANPVPEPTTVGAIGLIAAAMLMRRRPRRT